MKINKKLILIFSLISLLPVILVAFVSVYSFQKGMKNTIGRELESLAREKAGTISLLIKERIEETEILAEIFDIKDAVRKSNDAYINRSEDEIKDTIIQIDKEWIESKGATKTADQILNNSLSAFLKTLQSKYDAEYGDIFVTDMEGAAVAMTKTLTDYYQSDEEWWENTHNQGRGSVFIDDRGYDISVNALVLGVSVPIKEGEDVIGVLKISYKVEDILDVATNLLTEETIYAFLVRSHGDTLVSSSEEIGTKQLTNIEKNIIAKEGNGWVEDIHGSERTIMGYSTIDADIYTRVSSPGERKGVSGEKWKPTKWFLLLDRKQSEAFAPVYYLRNIIIIITMIIILIVIVIALFVAKSISTPIRLLEKGVKVIGAGNLDYKVAVNTKDEIGQLSEAFNNMSVDLKVSQKELLQYEHIISCSTDMLAFMDKKFIYVAANPAYLETFKKPREELIGHTASEVFGEELFDTVIKPNAELCLTGKEVNYQTWFKFPAYGQRYMDITYYPYTNADNAVIGFVVNGRNITEKKLAEEELVRSRQKSLLHVQRTPLAVIEWNTNFEVTEWNPAAEKIFGYRKKEALGHHAEFIIHENAKELVNEVWQNLLAQQGGKRSTNENITKDGNTIFCEWYNTPLVSESGEVLGVASLAQDVTEVKLAEEKVKAINASLEQRVTERTAELVKANKKIQDSEKTLRSIIDNTIAVIYLKDIQGKYILINSQYELLFHVSKEEVVGKTDYDLFPEDKADAFLRNDRKVIEVRQPLEFEEIVPHDDGLHTYISIKFPLFSAEDAVYGVCSISTDITELKKMEDELAKVQKLESVGTLASGIAHDFNNYLQGIMSNITTVKECIETSDELYRNLANAEKAVLQAKDLTQQLLTFSRGGEPVKKAVFASELIKESANFALSGSNVRCELDVPDCRCLVEADKGQMNQVINNLLINANQAMPEGGVVKIKAENTNIKAKDSLPLKEGKYVRITIADQGTGISKEHLQKIFDPFFTTKKEGTGLGLTTAYSIIKRHGGYITVESKVGTGTTFYIYLPASEGKISSETVPIKERDKRGKGKDVEKATPLEDGKRILFMEDNLLISMSVAEHLRNLKYEVQTTQNGTKAIELYKSAIKSGKPFDAVVMDLTIPDDMGGKEAIKELLKIDPNVKAVVASGYSNDPVMANFRKYGFRGVVAKPYEAYDLDELLQKVIAEDN